MEYFYSDSIQLIAKLIRIIFYQFSMRKQKRKATMRRPKEKRRKTQNPNEISLSKLYNITILRRMQKMCDKIAPLIKC